MLLLTNSSFLLLYWNSVLNNDSVKLIEKVKLAYEEYFGEIPDDCLLAFLINPVLATLGIADLKILLNDEVFDNAEGTELVTRAIQLLRDHLKHILRSKFQEQAPSSNSDNGNIEGLFASAVIVFNGVSSHFQYSV
jgi:hypothetical protein